MELNSLFPDGVFFVPGLLGLFVLALLRGLPGRRWLFAYVLLLLASAAHPLMLHYALRSPHSHSIIRQAYAIVFSPIHYARATVFGLFWVSAYFSTRGIPDMTHQLFSFSGRVPRSVFWLIRLAVLPLTVSPFLIYASEVSASIKLLALLLALTLDFWVNCALNAKRWHDLGKTGWLSLLHVIPVLGWCYCGIHLGFVKGQMDGNQYGPPLLKPEGS